MKKMNYHFRLLLMILSMVGCSYLHAQRNLSLFDEATDVDYQHLNTLQQSNYDILSQNPDMQYIKLTRMNTLSRIQDKGKLNLNLSFLPCGSLTFRAKKVDYTNDDAYLWYGEVISTDESDSVCSDGFLTLVNYTDSGGIMGSLKMNNFDVEIRDLSGGIVAFVVLDQDRMNEGNCGARPTGPIDGGQIPLPIGGPDCVKKDVKILVLYTDAAQSKITKRTQSGQPNLWLDATFHVTGVNTRLSNSDIPYRVALAGVETLPGYVGINNTINETKQIANYPPAQTFRDYYHADIVVLMEQAGLFGSDTWGNTRNVGSYNPAPPYNLDPAYAYCVVDIGKSISQATFAHEVAHVLGARHDRHTDINQLNISYLDPNARGYKFSKWYGPILVARYRTTMAYPIDLDRRTLVPYYSNPDVKYTGCATGDAANNNAGQMKQHTPLIGAFYTEPAGFSNYFDVQFYNYPANPHGLQHMCTNYAVLTAHNNGCTLLSGITNKWQTSIDGINWQDAGTGNTLTVDPVNPNVLVKLITGSTGPFISSIVYQHTILFNCPGMTEGQGNRPNKPQTLTAAENVDVYPNPNTGSFTLTYTVDKDQNGKILLLDLNGRVLETLHSGRLLQGAHQLNKVLHQKYPAGMYIIQIRGESINHQVKFTLQ